MKYLFTALLLASLAMLSSGCQTETGSSPADSSSTGSGESHDHEDGDHSHDDEGEPTSSSESSDIEEALAKLSPEDAESAKAQKICPVSDAMLGSMDAPVKVDVNGTNVWICCEHCKEELLAKPDEYVAKISK